MDADISSVEPPVDLARLHERTVAMNEALILGAVRQHELTDAAQSLNAQLHTTARVLAEKARLLELSKDAIIVRGFDDRITSWNNGAEKFFGWTASEVIGKDLHDLLKTEFPIPRVEIMELLRREGEFAGEVVQIARDGRRVSSLCRWVRDEETKSILTSYTDITDRKRAEEALRESEERYRNLFNSIDEGYCIIEMIFDAGGKAVDWLFLEVNPSFQVQTGLPASVGKRIREILPDHEEYWFETYGKVALTGEPVRFVNEARGLGGRWFDLYAFRIGGTSSRKVAVIFTDISKRRHTEEELSEKARLLDMTHDAIIVRGMEGEIRYWNHGAEELYGWSREEALGQISHVLLKTEFPAPVEQMLEELLRNDHWVGELLHLKRDGERITVLVRKTLVRDRAGQPAAVLENITDITDRKRAEEILRRSEEFNRSIIVSSPDCIKVLDLEGKLLSMESGQALLGIDDIRPYLNTSWIDFWTGEDRVAARAAVQAAAEGREGNFVGFFRTPHGEPKWWNVTISPILDVHRKAARLLAISRDVTAGRALEDALSKRAAQLARADRSKDEFLAMLAHELRNPLAPLRNAAEILQTAEATPSEREQAQHMIGRQIENMSRMIDDLLDVSRITEGKIELRKKPVALEAILTAAISLVSSNCAARHQDLEVSLPADPVFLDADATRLEQVFTNLLGNACKYSHDGCHISLSAERALGVEPPEVIVRVRDDGYGIAPDLLPRVFELFVQATRTLDRAHGGLGIGLTLVSRLVKMHGGSVEALSEGLGCGSEFIVRLPVLRHAPPPLPAPPPPLPAASETSRRILVVDDNADSARSMAILQTRRGHVTRVAFTGPDALAVAAEFLPEVVLLDIGLPGMDGYEVARQLRRIPAFAATLLIAMTGYASPEDLLAAKQAGFDEHLVKPVDLEVLRGWLRTRV